MLKKSLLMVLIVITNSTTIFAHGKLTDLLQDFKRYTTSGRTHHSGDLYEHSLWSANAVLLFAKENSFWTESLSPHDIKTTWIAALLHDIGKGGDNVLHYLTKPTHPEDGFQILLGNKKYHMADGTFFNVDELFDDLKVSPEDRALIIILVGCHWNFGKVTGINQQVQAGCGCRSDNLSVNYQWFLEELGKLSQAAGYRNGAIDERLVKLSILINAADIKGSQAVPCPPKEENPLPIDTYATEPHPVNHIVYQTFDCENVGKNTREEILTYYKLHYTS